MHVDQKTQPKRHHLELDKVIYLDHNATTPLDPRVFDAMKPYFLDSFGNASSIDHKYGNEASSAVESSRKKIADAIGAKPNEIVFTSGATESDNLALCGVMERYKDKGNHIITCVTEHEAILNTSKYLENMGKKVTYLHVDNLGRINMDNLEDAITDETVIISIMAANNEIGTIHDIKTIGKIAHENGVLFHTDAAQAVGHIPIDVQEMNIDLMSFSAHKMYGPKGTGALYVREIKPRVKLNGIIHGGGQERHLRSGTLNVPGIVGFGEAIEIAVKCMESEARELRDISKNTFNVLSEEDVLLNGDPENRLPGNLNVCYPGIEGKAIINSVSEVIAISAGSACTTQSVEASHVIMALGYGEERAHSSIRMGIGRYTEKDDAEFGAWEIVDAVRNITKIMTKRSNQ